MEPQGQVRAASMQRLLAEHISSHLEVKQFEPQQLLSILSASWNLRETRMQRHKCEYPKASNFAVRRSSCMGTACGNFGAMGTSHVLQQHGASVVMIRRV